MHGATKVMVPQGEPSFGHVAGEHRHGRDVEGFPQHSPLVAGNRRSRAPPRRLQFGRAQRTSAALTIPRRGRVCRAPGARRGEEPTIAGGRTGTASGGRWRARDIIAAALETDVERGSCCRCSGIKCGSRRVSRCSCRQGKPKRRRIDGSQSRPCCSTC